MGGGGGQGVRTPWKITKNIGFLSNTGSDPLKITKLAIQQSMAFRWRAEDGTNSGIKVEPRLTKLSGSARENRKF